MKVDLEGDILNCSHCLQKRDGKGKVEKELEFRL